MVDAVKGICRICLTETDKKVSMNDCHNETTYYELIKEYIGFDLFQNNDIPNGICDICSSELMIVVTFVSKCRTSNEKFQNLALNPETLHLPLVDDIKEEKNEFIASDPYIKEEKFDVDFFDENSTASNDQRDNILVRTKKRKRKKKSKKHPKIVIKKDSTCNICGLVTASNAALVTHMRKHTGERPYSCNFCSLSFSQKGTLNEHVARKHIKNSEQSKKVFICDVCGKHCHRKPTLTVHMRIHTKEKPYKCKHCPYAFAQIGTLIEHTRLHTGERPYVCHMCVKNFRTLTSLRKHLVSHSSDKNFRCHLCGKPMKSKGSLRTHLKLHTSERPFKCEKCPMTFSQKFNYQKHVSNMHSELSGTCNTCGKDFPNMEVHNRVHTGERPFVCEICNKKFSFQRYLTAHMNRHKQPYKFSCKHEQCNAAFPMQKQLEYHELKCHGNFFPFKCKICSKGYYRSSDLKRHEINTNCKEKLSDSNLKAEPN